MYIYVYCKRSCHVREIIKRDASERAQPSARARVPGVKKRTARPAARADVARVAPRRPCTAARNTGGGRNHVMPADAPRYTAALGQQCRNNKNRDKQCYVIYYTHLTDILETRERTAPGGGGPRALTYARPLRAAHLHH
ncbi:hypothetical protein EVAR_19358_1 [Eumeta japonica]|uniref:Uncharacterized protein n=1 Tax=Eumeta variegata TaxID=151549 RepID=A0A4C1TRD8_EUMVA|nr:hypothetical protein EVAR_19358_1 [Eumeta japonica]